MQSQKENMIIRGEHFVPKAAVSSYVACVLGHVQLFANLWTVARQTSLSMAFSRHKYWSRLPFPLPGDLPDPAIELASLESLPGGVFTIALPQVKSIFDRIFSFFKFHSPAPAKKFHLI